MRNKINWESSNLETIHESQAEELELEDIISPFDMYS